MTNIDPKKADELLKTVSKKLNIPPEKLKKQLEEGKFDEALNNMDKSQSQKFNMILNNPKLMEKFMSAPQAQSLYKKLTGGK